MLNKSTLALSLIVLLGGLAPALADPVGAPIPVIGVGAVASAAVAGAMVVTRFFMKKR
jgi:hypothetical protein